MADGLEPRLVRDGGGTAELVDFALQASWHAAALTRNALQAPWIARQFGQGEDAANLTAKEKGKSITDYLGPLWDELWADIEAARPLIVQAVDLFDQAQKTPSPLQGKLVAQGNQLLAQASPSANEAVQDWFQIRDYSLDHPVPPANPNPNPNPTPNPPVDSNPPPNDGYTVVITADQIREIYPLPPAPRAPKALPAKATKAQRVKFAHDLKRYEAARAKYDAYVAPINGRIEALANFLNTDANRARYGLDSAKRRAYFLGQMGAETAGLKLVTEGASKWTGPNFEKYGADTAKGKSLGNTQPGDGARFRGRGLFQITGRGAYTAFANASGIDVVNHPELVAGDPNVSAEAAAYYWSNKFGSLRDSRTGGFLKKDPVTGKSTIVAPGPVYRKFHLYEFADRGEIYSLSKTINAGAGVNPLHYDQRVNDTAKALKILGVKLKR